MQQYMLKYLITCTATNPFGEMVTKYDPLLLEEVNLVLTSMVGESCSVQVEQIELVDSEEFADQLNERLAEARKVKTP